MNIHKTILIQNTPVGKSHKVYVVAEIGINHNGSIKLCKKLIDLAVNCGCDAVKFQKRNPNICVPEEQKSVMKETCWGRMTYLDYKKRMEFGKKEYKEIDAYCKTKGITWFASAWDIDSVKFLKEFNIPCYKIPSALLTNKSLLTALKKTKKPLILSTGMSSMEQINKAVKFLKGSKLIILHCTSTYPTATNEHDLNVIKTFKKKFKHPIGYSGHEAGVYPTIAAIALGACFVERHITLDRAMYGTDQAASLEKRGLAIICQQAKDIGVYLGNARKKVYASEKPILKKLRRVDDL